MKWVSFKEKLPQDGNSVYVRYGSHLGIAMVLNGKVTVDGMKVPAERFNELYWIDGERKAYFRKILNVK